MRELFWCLVLGTALVGATAMAQEIVIEPTNGRASAGHSASVPARTMPDASRAATHSEARPATHAPQNQARTASRKLAKKASSGEAEKSNAASTAEDKHISGTSAPAQAMTKNEGAGPAEVSSKPSARPAWAMDDSRDAGSLQSEISNALARDPRLERAAIHVKVDDAAVTLEGRAEGAQERLQAERLAQSYAWNRRLVDHIEVVSSLAQK